MNGLFCHFISGLHTQYWIRVAVHTQASGAITQQPSSMGVLALLTEDVEHYLPSVRSWWHVTLTNIVAENVALNLYLYRRCSSRTYSIIRKIKLNLPLPRPGSFLNIFLNLKKSYEGIN